MARINLKHMIGDDAGLRPVIDSLLRALGSRVSIEDQAGRSVFGDRGNGTRVPLLLDDRQIGAVSGQPHAPVIAELLQYLVTQEAERKMLGAEVLNLYREVNLIYGFSEKLAALLDLERVCQLTMHEARHLIVATDGAILLLDDATQLLSPVAAFGDELPTLPPFARGHGIVGCVAASGIGEIVNDVRGDARLANPVLDVRSIVCAPLKVGERVTGVIVLASTLPMAYAARELKLLTTLALQTATAIENARLFERTVQAARERERLLALNKAAEVARAGFERELELAARIQADLFPAALPPLPGYDVAAKNRPARRCGGDYYDAITMPPSTAGESVLFCVADVAGKGLPASLLMSHTQATLRALLGRIATLQELAGHANTLLHGCSAANKYVTAALLELAPASGRATYVSAGHISSLHVGVDGQVTRLHSTGPPLGLLHLDIPYGSDEVTLAPGECIVLCSDGVTDAQNGTDEEFGDDRLADIIVTNRGLNAGEMVSRVFAAIDQFAGTTPQFDDITLMIVKRAR